MSALTAITRSDSSKASRPLAGSIPVGPGSGARRNPSRAVKAASGLPPASSSKMSVPVVTSARASAKASAAAAPGPPSNAVPDSHGGVASGPAVSETPPGPVLSVAQAALALAAALKRADCSASNENSTVDIAAAFRRTGPEGFLTHTSISNPTKSVKLAKDIDTRLKNLETRIEIAITKSDESLLKAYNVQKALTDLITNDNRRTKDRLAAMRDRVAELNKEAIALTSSG